MLKIFFLSWIVTANTSTNPFVNFFRDPTSLFPSGQSRFETLESQVVGNSQATVLRVEKDGNQSWIHRSDLVRDADLWTSKSESASDLSKALTLLPCPLKASSNPQAATLMNLPQLSPVWIVEIGEEMAKVRFGDPYGIEGYLSLQHLAVRPDFAAFVADQKAQWKAVRYRLMNRMILQNGESLLLSDVRFVFPDPTKARMLKSTGKLIEGNFVKVIEDRTGESGGAWLVSRLQGHGEVYWQRPNRSLEKKSSNTLSTADLLKMEIYSTSFASKPSVKNSQVGLVSADGIFHTQDGKNWEKIEAFGNQNFPVLIGNSGELFVGHQWSRDSGKTFQPYIKFESLAREHPQGIRTIKMESIEQISEKNFLVTLDTGVQKVILQGNPETQSFVNRKGTAESLRALSKSKTSQQL